ncbi:MULTISPECIES: hypothetical protein [unclassified Sphingomonas]|jgi:site-specific DNA recombinase|uniref:hypothetical protein n=1 Tax=unclassified Sphingomonas TaxID=196159 RepID=UPI0010F62A92|nr:MULTISPECIES: hypothetical protein [unclassified Sphingomonas]
MEKAVRDVLDEAAAQIIRHEDAFLDDERRTTDAQRRQMEADRLQLEGIDRRLQGHMSAIEDGLYTATLKARFLQLEDQAENLRAKLRINGRAMENAREQPASRRNHLRLLIAKLRTGDIEEDILQFRRMLGAINVLPEPSRDTCSFSPTWRPPGKRARD